MLDRILSLFGFSVVDGGVFLTIGVIGAVLLVLSLLLDGIFDFFDFGDGPLSLTTIAAFATIFGFTAFGLVGAGLETLPASLFGGLAGLGGGFLAWWLSRLMSRSESNSAASSAEMKGSEALVVLAIPDGGGLGEISLSMHGERISLSATAATSVERGKKVIIEEMLTPTSALVKRVEE